MIPTSFKKNLIPLLVTFVVCALASPVFPGIPSGPITDVLAIGGALWALSLMAPAPPANL